ncbi:MAG: enolase C-terminal domain-like protein [Candidatus Limnocylindrales bacterium]|jgi:L-alanine-DL-glutamate epimerase-like enolase superfamily enzyme
MPASDPAALRRLARVEAIHVRVPFRRPLLDATGEYTHRRSWLLRVVDEDGNEGLGEAALNPIASDVAAGALARLVREIAPGLAVGRLPSWPELAAEGEPGRAAMAAVDGAIAALAAARNAGDGVAGDAAHADPASIPVCATISFGGPDAGADAASQAVELGFETLKLRAGFERTTDQLVDRLRALRAAVGPEPRLRIDGAGAWDLETAVERIAGIEPFRIEYVEQPLAAWDVTGHAALRERVRVPIALDESIDSEGAARAALAERAADVVVVKPARVGGLAATMRIVEAAAAAGVSVVLGTYFETGVGIAAVLRIGAAMRAGAPAGARAGGRATGRAVEGEVGLEPAHGLATAGLLVHDLLAVPLSIDKGRMAVPAAVTLDESEVDRYTLERFEAQPTR